MKIRSLIAAVLALGGAASAGATILVNDYGSFTVSYDDSTVFGSPSFSFTSGGGVTGFGWSVPGAVNVSSLGAPMSVPFAMPDFTVAANPGWSLSGPVAGFLGNLVFTEVGDGALTTATAAGTFSIDGGAGVSSGGALAKVPTLVSPPITSGYYAGSTSFAAPAFTILSFTGGSLTLTAAGGAFSSIIAQPQNELKFSVVATPVPEPETWALLAAGLLSVMTLARRRRQD